MSHFATQLIGKPYVSGGDTLEGFDCWGLFRFVQKNFYDLELPIIDVDTTNVLEVARKIKERKSTNVWRKVDVPNDGCAVLLAHARYPSHVGVWLDVDNGGVLHCVKGAGVVFTELSRLKLSGWGRIEYYEHCSRS